MFFEDAQNMAMLYSINPELTCQCDEVHICQQCHEEWQEEKKLKLQKFKDSLKKK